MKSSPRGKSTSSAEILTIDPHGLWLFAEGKEYFLPYSEFPWFKEARVMDVLNLQLLHGFHLYWPTLDIDLSLDSLEDTSSTPLIYR